MNFSFYKAQSVSGDAIRERQRALHVSGGSFRETDWSVKPAHVSFAGTISDPVGFTVIFGG